MANSLLKICRLCADNPQRLIEIKKKGETSELASQIEQYLHVEVNDLTGCSFQICRLCRGKVERWGKFFQHVLSVQTCFDPLNNAVLKNLVESKTQKKFYEQDDVDVVANEHVEQNAFVEPEIKDNEKENRGIQDNDGEPATSDKENDQGCKDVDSLISNDQGAGTNQVQYDNSQADSESDGQEESLLLKSASWQCHVCNYALSSWKSLIKHCSKQHNTKPQYHCLCGEILHSLGTINKHCLKHEKGLQFKCDKCNKSFHRKSLLQVHALSHLPKEEQPWICDTCHRRFHSKNLLRQHKQRHLPLDRKFIYPCEICEKKFCSKWAAAAHTRNIHFRERLFVCDQCGLKFASKGVLDEHLIVHSNQFNYQCKDCGKMFKTKYRLRIHADTHLQTRYACPVCNLSLNTRRTLRMHLLVHKDKKDFSCDTCGKGFKRSKDLKNHMNLHTGLRPYSCQFCDRTFANGPNCRSHKLRIHREELKLLEDSSNAQKQNVQKSPPQNISQTLVTPIDTVAKPLENRNIDDLHAIMTTEEMTDCLDLQLPLHVMNFSPPHLSGFSDGPLFAKEP